MVVTKSSSLSYGKNLLYATHVHSLIKCKLLITFIVQRKAKKNLYSLKRKYWTERFGIYSFNNQRIKYVLLTNCYVDLNQFDLTLLRTNWLLWQNFDINSFDINF